MTFAENCNKIFERAVADYHKADSVDVECVNPYSQGDERHMLYAKAWVDAVQWHLEDLIRDPAIDPGEALALKRRIDRQNQERADLVEALDSYLRDRFASVKVLPTASVNTESPAWALDRLSILSQKIYHMDIEAERTDADEAHRSRCAAKLAVLREQRSDLTAAIDCLLDDIAAGRKYMKVYRQMKMYNDNDTNPVLYGSKRK